LKALPATAPVPVRLLLVVLAATVKPTVPEPVRPVPFWNVRKPLELVALQAQPVCVVTEIVPLEPAAAMLTVAGLIEYVQLAPACETVNVLPPTLAIRLRELLVVLAATVNPTVPELVRPVPFWNVRKPLELVALQAHPV
jgi:hypothetical protein